MILNPERISQLYFEAAMKYNEVLNGESGTQGLQYLVQRGFNQQFLNQYTVGFAPYNPDRGFLFRKLVDEFKCEPIDLITSKLSTILKSDRRVNDYFGSQRVIFPVYNEGKIVAFSSRTIMPNVEPRYKTLSNNGLGLYNTDIVDFNQNVIYIAEGAIDTLTLELMGYPAVGILGLGSFGKENATKFENYGGKVVLVMDTDKNLAGQKARQRIANILFGLGVKQIFYKDLPFDSFKQKSTDINDFMVARGIYRAKIEFGELPEYECRYQETPTRSFPKLENMNLGIVATVRPYVQEITQDGPGRFRCLCPLHIDSTPSFVMYTETNMFKCFGCNESGNAIKFLMLKEGLEYGAALQQAITKIDPEIVHSG